MTVTRESVTATENRAAGQFVTTMGPHLMLDCRGCNPEKIADMAYIWKVLDELPAAVGMTKITQPYVFPYSGLVPEDKGVTGFVVIAESHLAFHSFTDKDYFFFDLFSCKPFDVEAAKQYLQEAFEVQDLDAHFVERGRYFPREEASTPVVKERHPDRVIPFISEDSNMTDITQQAKRIIV